MRVFLFLKYINKYLFGRKIIVIKIQNRMANKKETPLISQFGDDLTQMAADKKLDAIIGRDAEVERICQILSRRKKNNPIILGDPGVGKTALVEAIAQRIVNKQVPMNLFDKRIISLNISNIVAGTKYRGEFEDRMKNIVNELKANKDIIVFIDEIHTLVGAGGTSGSLDASNILKPALARGQVQCIGATTLDEYRENIEIDGALTRRFQEVFIDPPSIEDSVEILNKIKDNYENYHNVSYTDDAIEACVLLSDRYITQRELPDKAIDLMDEAGAKVHLSGSSVPEFLKEIEEKAEAIKLQKLSAVEGQDYEKAAKFRDAELSIRVEIEDRLAEWKANLSNNKKVVSYEDIAAVISQSTGIPVSRMTDSESKVVKEMESVLKNMVIGQDSAVESLCKVIKRSRAGVSSSKKPIGSFMFIGPTGVGKTETVKSLTEYYFGDESNLIRIDMSEYQEKFNVSKLIGSPPGYVGYESGGQLTEAVRRKPYSVVLFDEIEKAHPDTFNILLQVLDEGRLTDSLGRTIDFTNTVIIMTSNVGAKRVSEFGSGIGFESNSSIATKKTHVESVITKELKNKFAPEFLNRLDDIILFNSLSKDDVLKIVDIELAKVITRMDLQGYKIKLTKMAKDFLADVGYDPLYGARPLKRAVQTYVEDILADAIIDGELKKDKVYTITKVKSEDKLYIKI
jgi:ATP-dependent Clp protease ATP-binding subunit ClpC